MINSNLKIFYDYIDVLNKELKESLFYYTTYEYKNLNQSIRSNLLLSNENRKHYNNILSIFESGPIIKDTITVFRGMTKKYSIIEGQHGFISTTTDIKIAKRFSGGICCIYVITLTPGQYTILPLETISDRPDEKEILLPPGKLSIQSIVQYNDPNNDQKIDLIYCTYIPNNANIINTQELIELNKEKFESNIIKLSTQSWVDRILNSNIIEEITELCENEDNKDITNDITENYKKCISDSLKTLDFYEDIPKEAIEKTIKLLLNVHILSKSE